jgi:hypothetical protein
MSTAIGVEELARGFACPQVGLEEDFLECIAVGFARDATHLFLERFGQLVTTAAPGLPGFLAESMDSELGFDESWDSIFGEIGEALTARSGLEPSEIALRLGLWLHSNGRPGSWRFEGPEVGGRRWGPWSLPAGDTLEVESDGATARVLVGRHGSSKPVRLRRIGNSWSSDDVDSCQQILMTRHRLTFLTQSATESPECRFLRDDLLEPAKWGDVPAQYIEAFSLLRDHAPIYLDWIDRLLRFVIPLKGRGGGHIVSGSIQSAPGIIHVSHDSSPASLAEMLVHETTHLYFHLLTRVSPVHDGSDATEYYSPIKRRGRPIHFILVAYHAFANVMLFYRLCQDSGYPDPDGYIARNVAELLPQLAQLDTALQTTQSLTPIGRALWEPLAEMIT